MVPMDLPTCFPYPVFIPHLLPTAQWLTHEPQRILERCKARLRNSGVRAGSSPGRTDQRMGPLPIVFAQPIPSTWIMSVNRPPDVLPCHMGYIFFSSTPPDLQSCCQDWLGFHTARIIAKWRRYRNSSKDCLSWVLA